AADALHLPEGLREEYSRAAVTMYDAIGEKRRESFVAAAASRRWAMVHLILRSDRGSIALGTGRLPRSGARPRRISRRCPIWRELPPTRRRRIAGGCASSSLPPPASPRRRRGSQCTEKPTPRP